MNCAHAKEARDGARHAEHRRVPSVAAASRQWHTHAPGKVAGQQRGDEEREEAGLRREDIPGERRCLAQRPGDDGLHARNTSIRTARHLCTSTHSVRTCAFLPHRGSEPLPPRTRRPRTGRPLDRLVSAGLTARPHAATTSG